MIANTIKKTPLTNLLLLAVIKADYPYSGTYNQSQLNLWVDPRKWATEVSLYKLNKKDDDSQSKSPLPSHPPQIPNRQTLKLLSTYTVRIRHIYECCK
jgi:hypothetical protein